MFESRSFVSSGELRLIRIKIYISEGINFWAHDNDCFYEFFGLEISTPHLTQGGEAEFIMAAKIDSSTNLGGVKSGIYLLLEKQGSDIR